MYKLVINENTYELHKYDIQRSIYNLSGKFKTIPAIEKFVTTMYKTPHMMNEINQALKEMSDSNHNTAELGYNGLFTISYYDNKVKDFF